MEASDARTPLIFIGLYRLFRTRNSRWASLKEAWRRTAHRL